jgi:hypothetical protein
MTADVMWLLATHDHVSRGAHCELGARLAVRKREGLFISGARGPLSIFYAGISWAAQDQSVSDQLRRYAVQRLGR